MDKNQIIKEMKLLEYKIRKRGRYPSREAREEMREQVRELERELKRILLGEDQLFIQEFELKHPDFYHEAREMLKIGFSQLLSSLHEDETFMMKKQIERCKSELRSMEYQQEKIISIKQQLQFHQLEIMEKESPLKPFQTAQIENLQSTLAEGFRRLEDNLRVLKQLIREISGVYEFFREDTEIYAFVYLTDPIFTQASDFEKGYALVEQGAQQMYCTHAGITYSIGSHPDSLPKMNIRRPCPDLFPFEETSDQNKKLFGYRNAKNETIIAARFTAASAFVNGFARVRLQQEEKDKYLNYGVGDFLIDTAGNVVLLGNFFEISEVHHDRVMYKKHLYRTGYEVTFYLSLNVERRVEHLGLFCGFLKYAGIKATILQDLESIREIRSMCGSSDKRIHQPQEKIKALEEKIECYLKYVINRQTQKSASEKNSMQSRIQDPFIQGTRQPAKQDR